MTDNLPERLRAWSDDAVLGRKVVGASSDLRDAAREIEQSRYALKLPLEYWRHRQQRYKNRFPEWVIAARELVA